MEIKDYLRVLGKRAWLLVMIPAVAGVVAGLIAVGQPQAFRTSATLQLPRDETTTPAQVAQLVADFQAAANNPTVQNQVSENTGVPVRRIQRVRITQVGDSSQLTMSFQDKRKDATEAKAVIDGLAAGALGYLNAPEDAARTRAVEEANAAIDTAEQELTTANAELQAIYQRLGTSQPLDDIERLKDQVVDLDTERVRAEAGLQTVQAERYRNEIEAKNLQIVALTDALGDVQELELRSTEAQDALVTAQETLNAAVQEQDGGGAAPTPIFSAEGQSVVRKTRVVKTAAAAVVAGFPIAIGVVLLLDAAQKRRANRPARPDHDDELAGGADDEHELEPAIGAASPALIGASAGPAGLPAAAATAVVEDDVDEDEYDDYDADQDEADEDLDEGDEDLDDEDEAVVVADVIVEEDLDDDLDDELEDELDRDIDDGDIEDELDDDAAVDDAEVLDDLDEADVEETEAELIEDEAELEDDAVDEADLDEAELDELALAGLDEAELDEVALDDDLADADLGDDLEDELDDDVAATVASRRRLYDADIDDDLSVDGGPAEHDGPEHNGQSRVWARVPAADSDFDGDDEAGADR